MEKNDQRIWSLAMGRIEDWKSRLIDLSRRNNLLYFRRTKTGNLSVSRPSAETVFNSLILRHRNLEFWLLLMNQRALRSNQELTSEARSYQNILLQPQINWYARGPLEGISRGFLKTLADGHSQTIENEAFAYYTLHLEC